MTGRFIFIAILTVATQAAQSSVQGEISSSSKEVCYPVLGCFNSLPPFDNADGHLPQSPAKVDTRFELYTRANMQQADLLWYTQRLSITQSHFNSTRLTKVITHGFKNCGNTVWVKNLTAALLMNGDYNVLVVDWPKGSPWIDYSQATANVRLVATQLKSVLHLMQRYVGLSLADVHLIGHSLGAHVSGYAGSLLDGMVGRITGLDPADPKFSTLPESVRLDYADAKFVDVMHTDGETYQRTGGYGLMEQSGHVDFYMNGGEKQPGCTDGFAGAFDSFRHFPHLAGLLHPLVMIETMGDGLSCSHSRAHEFFLESINSTSCKFRSFPCGSYEEFLAGHCFDCGVRGMCSEAGFHAADHPLARGKQYLMTFPERPFCGSSYYEISIEYAATEKQAQGEIQVRFRGSDSRAVGLFGSDTEYLGWNTTKAVILVDKSLEQLAGGPLDAIAVTFVWRAKATVFPHFNRDSATLTLERINVTELLTGRR